jgi:hypothetical protein
VVCGLGFGDFVGIFARGIEKSEVQAWFFGGQNVVICVVNVVNKTLFFV